MEKESSYTIFTDASFDNETNVSTYSIIVKKDSKTTKIISRKPIIKMTNSVECEIFAIYQAINLILSAYINKSKIQTFSINTDCSAARDFYLDNSSHQKVFSDYSDLYLSMKKIYKTLCYKLGCYNSSFNIKWIPRKNNSLAHRYAYTTFQRLKSLQETNNILVIDKKTFFEVLMNSDKKLVGIILFLYNTSNQQRLIIMTQTQMAKKLEMSVSMVNRYLKKLQKNNILQKIKNGKYALLL